MAWDPPDATGLSATDAGVLTCAGLSSTGALTCTTLAASAAVTCATTLGVTGVSTLAGTTCTTLTASGAVQCDTTLGVTGVSTLAGTTCTTLTASGAVQCDTTLAVTGAVTLSSALNCPRRTNAGGAAGVIGTADFYIGVSSINTGAILMTETMADGQLAVIEMTAFDTDAYTLVVGGGTLTFNAVDESAVLFHNGTEVIVLALSGATIV